jgi:ribosome-associated protein
MISSPCARFRRIRQDNANESRKEELDVEGALTPKPRKLRLDQFLKWLGVVGTGGEAKHRIQNGEVKVNGAIEARRGRGLRPGDEVEFLGQRHLVEASLWNEASAPDPE